MLARAACVGIAVAFGSTLVFAQDIIAQRQALMKSSGAEAKIGAQMARGSTPFDLARAKQIFTVYSDKAAKLPNMFPDNSKTGGDTRAAPAIWEKPDQWKAEIAKFAADSKKGLEITDLDSFKAAFSAAGRDCGSCHETFRKN